MDKLRLTVWIALAGLLYICYMTWLHDYPPAPAPVTDSVASTPAAAALPELPGETAKPIAAEIATTTSPAAAEPMAPAPKIKIKTDVIDLAISLRGGEIDKAELLNYPVAKNEPNKLVRLFDSDSAEYFVARSGLRATDNRPAPTHDALFTSPQSEYQLAEGQDALTVPLTWTDDQGVTVTKTFTFKRGQYAIGIDYKIDNQSSSEWKGASYVQFARRQPVVKASMLNAEGYAFMGPAVGTGTSVNRLKLDKEETKNYNLTQTEGWLAVMQHHFVAAAVPPQNASYDYHVQTLGPNEFVAGYRGPILAVQSRGTGEFHESLYVGPTLQSQLVALHHHLYLTADYGWLSTIARPLFIVLQFVFNFVGNWGWAIILVTLLIKLAFYKLTEASGKSMAKMREMAPRLKALQERYKDDREQLGRATMEFYKREKINPLAGCLPTLIQMPVFMAFYWVILNSAEMRQAPFISYLTDLSSRDPYFILPIILGVANFMQFKLNPAPADPVQAKVMMMMPIVMTGMMVMFPSGLVLYWITNTGLSILQQWHINRVVSGVPKKA